MLQRSEFQNVASFILLCTVFFIHSWTYTSILPTVLEIDLWTLFSTTLLVDALHDFQQSSLFFAAQHLSKKEEVWKSRNKIIGTRPRSSNWRHWLFMRCAKNKIVSLSLMNQVCWGKENFEKENYSVETFCGCNKN